MSFRSLLFCYLDWSFVRDFLSYQLFYFFPLAALTLSVELFLCGWAASSLRRLFRPDREDRWDLFSMLLFMAGGRRILGNFILLGTVAFWEKATDPYFPLVHVPGPFWLRFALAFLVNDFFNYWNHRLRHEVKWFWLVHEFHHSSPHLTLWTKFRVHALDYFVTMPIALTLPSMFFGWDVLAWTAFVFLSEFTGYVIHSRIDSDFGWLGRYVVVSPRFHHLHHERAGTTQKNYGISLVVWDRLFGTYEAPRKSVRDMKSGLLPNPYAGVSPLKAYLRPVWDFYRWPIRRLSGKTGA